MTDETVLAVTIRRPTATFGLIIDRGTRTVIAAPPIARYAIGWSAARAWTYFAGRGEVACPTRDRGLYR
jgi:hypothetical protein